MALKDIIGQDRPISILKGCMTKERIPHALLFAGDEGIGKRLTAVSFAKALNCGGADDGGLFAAVAEDDPGEPDMHGADCCDSCPSCMKVDKGNHPDVFSLGPEGDGRQITVSAIRKLEESLSYKPFEGKWKVAIIDDADRLNASAANAFLQTLEEPSAQSILILVSSRPDMILPTIRSRCQRVSFSTLPIDTMSVLLRDKFGLNDEARTRLLSMLSGGRLGYALDESLVSERDSAFRVLQQMTGSGDDDVWEDKDAMEAWFEWSQLVLRDMAVFKATGQREFLINQDRVGEIEALVSNAELPDILKLARAIYNIKGKLIFNLNKQITSNFLSLLLKKVLVQRFH